MSLKILNVQGAGRVFDAVLVMGMLLLLPCRTGMAAELERKCQLWVKQLLEKYQTDGIVYAPDSSGQLVGAFERLPKKAQKLTGKKHSCEGPNCWNATLLYYRPEMAIRHSDEHEMIQFLNQRARLIGPGERVTFGDIFVLHTTWPDHSMDGFDLLHTAIYTDDNYVWHKSSRFAEDPWGFGLLHDDLTHYMRRFDGRLRGDFFRVHQK